jgi:hypothetical protein
MAELEKELELALVEQVDSSSANVPTSPSPRSVEAPQDKIRSRKRRPEELQDACRHGIAQGLEELEQRETEVVERGGVAAQQEELTA